MYSLISSVALLYFCFAIKTTSVAEIGKDSSSAIPECSGSLDYKIADISNITNVSHSKLEESRKNIGRAIQNINKFADDQCAKGITKYHCEIVYPFRCTETYVEVSGKKIADTCEEARKDCASLRAEIGNSILNCAIIVNNPLSHIPKIPRKLMCGDFPTLKNYPYTCDAKYKYSVNETNNAEIIQGAHKMYQHLPDGTTAKTYPLDNAYESYDEAGSRTMAFTITLFIALVFAQYFF